MSVLEVRASLPKEMARTRYAESKGEEKTIGCTSVTFLTPQSVNHAKFGGQSRVAGSLLFHIAFLPSFLITFFPSLGQPAGPNCLAARRFRCRVWTSTRWVPRKPLPALLSRLPACKAPSLDATLALPPPPPPPPRRQRRRRRRPFPPRAAFVGLSRRPSVCPARPHARTGAPPSDFCRPDSVSASSLHRTLGQGVPRGRDQRNREPNSSLPRASLGLTHKHIYSLTHTDTCCQTWRTGSGITRRATARWTQSCSTRRNTALVRGLTPPLSQGRLAGPGDGGGGVSVLQGLLAC